MLKLKLIFAFLGLMRVLCYSQETYPSKIILNKDTVIAITVDQVRTINTTYANVDELREMNDSLTSQLSIHNDLRLKQKEIILNMGKQISTLEDIGVEKDNIIENNDKTIKDKDRLIKWLKSQRGGLSIVVLILSGLIIF